MSNLAAAYGVQKMSKGGIKCAHGGPISCSAGCYSKGGEVQNEKLHPSYEPKMKKPSSIVESIMAKKMASGGEVEDAQMSDDSAADDFLTADEESEFPEHGYPDPDGVESNDPSDMRKGILTKIMSRMHSKAYGK